MPGQLRVHRLYRHGVVRQNLARHGIADALGLGSTSAARRLIGQGGVRLDGEVVTELDLPRERLAGALLQAGKRRFARLVAERVYVVEKGAVRFSGTMAEFDAAPEVRDAYLAL